jgi:hypothetical protein
LSNHLTKTLFNSLYRRKQRKEESKENLENPKSFLKKKLPFLLLSVAAVAKRRRTAKH